MSSIWRQIANMPVLPKQMSTRGNRGHLCYRQSGLFSPRVNVRIQDRRRNAKAN